MTEIKHFDNRIEYHQNGKLHREDGPAIVSNNGNELWYLFGNLHRENGPAYKPTNRNLWKWFFNDKLHRVDGPAIKIGRYEAWYHHGRRHCFDEPALHWNENIEWYRYGFKFTETSALSTRALEITMALTPLQLPAYVVLWIMEWVVPLITKLNQPRLVQMIQNLMNRQLLKN